MRSFGNGIVVVCFAPLIFSAGGYAKNGSNNGVCGLSNGATLSSKPTFGLFSRGTTANISISGPWIWARGGSSTTTRCSATFNENLRIMPFCSNRLGHHVQSQQSRSVRLRIGFDDEFNTPATVDFSSIATAGYNWYTRKFFGFKTTPSSDIAIDNGVMTLNSTARGVVGGDISYALATAPANNAQGWIGKVFGGGAYFEARFIRSHNC